MAAQNNEKKSQQIGIQNQPGSTNYGTQIGIQNNFVINLKNYVNIKKNPNCPYSKSIFLPEDAEYFFGRDEFVKKLLSAIETNNFISVLGELKSGKSSVILAGLVPKLYKAKNWLFTFFRPQEDPFYNLAQALVPLYIPQDNKKELKTEAKKLKNSLKNNITLLSEIINKIQQKNPDKRILIIADQFEQLYNTSNKYKTRYKFINALLQTFQSATNKSPLSTILVTIIRTNSSGNIEFDPPLPDALKKHSITLEQMTGDQLREVIEKPTRNFGVSVKKRLVERLIEDAIKQQKQQKRLAVLAFALVELWKKQKNKELTYKAYQEITENADIVEVYEREQKKRAEQNSLTKKTSKNNIINEAPIIYRIVILLFLFFVGMPVILELFPVIFDSPVRIMCKLKDKC
ncbi:MAG: hypothetical protein F6K22_08655 [Okeania sp. SIO2F4]|uniref:nSTAND1 domain-containing NTPase n=1 Tax=Okeania sp. SIO2F4 TaxID=2607790 RepID=UPI00142B4107|nr:hypothetical protein [Okeania sp. SIO2F4]NES02908.1 hypothetical protein [Okeania sp. SIO2F4]